MVYKVDLMIIITFLERGGAALVGVVGEGVEDVFRHCGGWQARQNMAERGRTGAGFGIRESWKRSVLVVDLELRKGCV